MSILCLARQHGRAHLRKMAVCVKVRASAAGEAATAAREARAPPSAEEIQRTTIILRCAQYGRQNIQA
jgi:hypothetical protein